MLVRSIIIIPARNGGNRMRYIEFLGLPGSGKTTFAKKTASILREQHQSAYLKLEARTAVARAIIRDNQGILWQGIRMAASCAGYRMWNLMWEKHRYKILLNCLHEYPHLARFLIEAANSFETPSWLPEKAMSQASLLDWIFDTATHYHACQTYLKDHDSILQEEGFCQQAYYLLVAFRSSKPGEDLLTAYLDLIPKPRKLIFITTPAEQCEARMQQRAKGVSSDILRLMSVEDRLELLTHRLTTYKKIAHHLEQQGVDVIRLNHADYQTSLHTLKEHLIEPQRRKDAKRKEIRKLGS